MRAFILFFIKIYQVVISPLIPARCRFYPTCSEYIFEAIKKYGVIKGVFWGTIRLGKCHPFHPGGYDPIE